MATKITLMREQLLQAITDLKDNKITPEVAKSMAAVAQQVTASLDIELKVYIASKIAPVALIVDEPRKIASGIVHQMPGVTRHSIGNSADDIER